MLRNAEEMPRRFFWYLVSLRACIFSHSTNQTIDGIQGTDRCLK